MKKDIETTKDFTLYVQRRQANGYYPVERYRRENGRWYYACRVKDGWNEVEYSKEWDTNRKNRFYWKMFNRGIYGFFTEPKEPGRTLYGTELRLCDVKKMIFS